MTDSALSQLLGLAIGTALVCAYVVLWRSRLISIVRAIAVQGAAVAVVALTLGLHEHSVEPVAAAVGVNRQIIEDGVNGFLASTEGEWEEKLGCLIADPRLREKLGQAGRRTVTERYSLDVHAPTLVAVLRSAVERA